jgi:hypothetical protein
MVEPSLWSLDRRQWTAQADGDRKSLRFGVGGSTITIRVTGFGYVHT